MSDVQKIKQPTSTKLENNHYVDKTAMFNAYCEYAKHRDSLVADGLPKPKIPEFLGECIIKICEGLGSKWNFNRYSYRDVMVSEAIETCLKYFDNFNPEKTNQIFSYYTQVAYWAMVAVIEREKAEVYVKHKLLERHAILDMLAETQSADDVHLDVAVTTDYINDLVENYEKRMNEKKEKSKKKKLAGSLDKFIDEENQNEGNSTTNP